MKRRVTRFLSLALIVAVVVVIAAAVVLRADRALKVATGFISYTLCAEVFVSGFPPDEVYAQTLRPVPALGVLGWALRHQVNVSRRDVKATAFGRFESRAHASRRSSSPQRT